MTKTNSESELQISAGKLLQADIEVCLKLWDTMTANFRGSQCLFVCCLTARQHYLGKLGY